MVIQHNIMAMNSHRALTNNNSMVAKNLEKLSSGYRINRAGDDAAGLAISEKMRSQIKGLEQAQRNSQDGISLVQTAEGALTEVHAMLNRMVELATQSANGIYTSTDRQGLQREVEDLRSEIDRIADGTNFNGIKLLDGSISGTKVDGSINLSWTVSAGTSTTKAEYLLVLSAGTTGTKDGTIVINVAGKDYTVAVTTSSTLTEVAAKVAGEIGATWGDFDVAASDAGIKFTAKENGKDFISSSVATRLQKASYIAGNAKKNEKGTSLQVGDSADDFNTVRASVDDMHVEKLGIKDISLAEAESAKDAIQLINTAIERVSKARSDLGATQNRLEHTINNLGVTGENLSAAESRIRDVDMAKEMMAFTKNNVLSQAAQSMLAQSNQQPQQILQLLR